MAAPRFDIGCIPALTDNYIWLLRCSETGEAAVIDPSVDGPVLNAFRNVGWEVGQILNTHWHPDHVGGNAGIKEATGCTITGPAAEADRIPGIDVQVREGDRVRVGKLEAVVWEVPGHTLGHIAYYFEDNGMLFIGDTLFAMGCGRLFEGTAEQMYGNMVRLRALPEDVVVYPAHEYTLANARFCVAQRPGDQLLKQRLAVVEEARARDMNTLPVTIGEERVTNPFLMAHDAAEFARLRAVKDSFS
ncbi:hydroxyacylglutathione hydrolase [Sphingomonas astaxanthinifaciens]|uniref:Hydroxyacylglutathione hydrolase n=1 Tax=Sphingomonas astaxanthinifaciens DSM 22298 TaxID=1123267 RepID=A0ABQ5Z3J0_9SPHN|nr:hydroxyacylglutathione hydrolase [Sphingomonas astaxanthinifaciens]GLR46560.1 hydroxyacylglutathione hydrolase [Sphingomonas astaxanthinifaciens DSM 22298]